MHDLGSTYRSHLQQPYVLPNHTMIAAAASFVSLTSTASVAAIVIVLTGVSVLTIFALLLLYLPDSIQFWVFNILGTQNYALI